jgi:hypothetical protein
VGTPPPVEGLADPLATTGHFTRKNRSDLLCQTIAANPEKVQSVRQDLEIRLGSDRHLHFIQAIQL